MPRAGPGVHTRADREAANGSLGLAFQSPALLLGRACVQPLLMRSSVPGDAGDGVPCSPSSAQEGLLIRAGVSIPEDWPGSGGAPRTPSVWIYLQPVKALGLCPERTESLRKLAFLISRENLINS